jgi:hypothetical protein
MEGIRDLDIPFITRQLDAELQPGKAKVHVKADRAIKEKRRGSQLRASAAMNSPASRGRSAKVVD